MKYYTVEDLSEMFGVKPITIYTWIRTKRIGSYQFSSKLIRVSQDQLDAFLKTHTQEATPNDNQHDQ